MSTTRRSYLIVTISSITVSVILTLAYYYFRPQPISIHEVSSTPVNNSITSHTTLTGRVTKSSTSSENGDFYLQTSSSLIRLEYRSDLDLPSHLATTVSITGELTTQLRANPDNIPVLTIKSISSQDSP